MLNQRLIIPLLALLASLVGFDFLAPERSAQASLALERMRAGLAEHEIDWNGHRIAYLLGGEGETLLLIHGFGADKDNFTRVSRFLTSQFRVIALDLPGFGSSDRLTDASYRVPDQVQRLREIVDAFGLERFHLGGSSMGGMLSASYAARYPDQVLSLWLLAPGGVAGSRPSQLRNLSLADNPLVARSAQEWSRVLDFTMARPPFLPHGLRQVLGERAARDFELHSRIYRELLDSEPINERVRGLTTPTLIVWGDRDRALHVSGATTLLKLMPNASALIYEGIGHLPMIERPRRSALDYLEFIERLPAS